MANSGLVVLVSLAANGSLAVEGMEVENEQRQNL